MAEKKIQGSITLVTVEDGAAGQNGAPGISMYTYVRYADDDNGTNISEKPTKTSKYIAVLTTTSPTAPSTGYIWSKYVGENGKDGINGKDGADGKDGKDGAQGIQGPPGEKGEDGTGVTILGSYSSEEELRTAHPAGKIGEAYLVEGSLYVWSETENDWTNVGNIQGPQGPAGQDGANGEDGIGVTHIEIKYAAYETNLFPPTSDSYWKNSIEETGIQDGQYLWTRLETFYSNSSSTIAHTVAKQGKDGQDGKDGDSYLIQSNVEEINKFYNEQANLLFFSPEKASFKVFKESISIKPGEDYYYKLALLTEARDGSSDYFDDLTEFFGNIDNDENFVVDIEDKDNKEEDIKLLEKVLYVVEDREVVFDLEKLTKCYLRKKDENSNDGYLSVFDLLKQIIEQKTSAFSFKVYKDDKMIALKVINCEWGLEEEIAKFKLTATQIQAAVDNANLIFSAEGLEIINGGFKITRTDEDEDKNKELLYFSNGNLFIEGNGTFTGTIFAEDGIFSGELSAPSGTIGGFIIEDNALRSSGTYKEEDTFTFEEGSTYYEKLDEEYIQTTDQYLSTKKEYYTLIGESYSLVTTAQFLPNRDYFELDENDNYIKISENEKANLNKKYYYIDFPIVLLGNEEDGGKIIANNIELGTGAKISKYIELGKGQAYIYNPAEYDGLFLSTGEENIQLDAEKETLTLGDIILDGKNSSISGTGFDIRPGFSSFDNVRVRGEIATSIFTKGSTQVVGGAMLFKIAYKIEKQELKQIPSQEEGQTQDGVVFTLNKDILYTFPADEAYITLVAKDGSLSEYFKVEKSSISASEGSETVNITLAADAKKVYNTLIVLGKNEDIIIGVNSENNRSALLEPRGLTISQLNITDTGLSTDLKAFLGDLTSLGLNGYGLYSNNVYLTGSLTTELSNGVYAGVNTLNGVSAKKFGEDGDKSNIVFWAGSDGTSETGIQEAAFQVTQKGSVYASQAFFEDSVIARSKITGADIYAARLHGVKLNDDGTPSEEAGALTIYDTSKGIIFKAVSDEGVETETFSISAEGLKVSDQCFITIDDKKAIFTGIGFFDEVNPKIINFNNSNNENKNIAQLYQEDDSFFIKHTDSNSSIKIKNEISFSFGGTDPKFVFSSSLFNVNVATANFSGNIRLGNEESNIEYRKVDNGKGYDLYVF